MPKKLSKSEKTRNFIIESTADIFNKKGYAGTSMSDLTNATGLSKGSIYGNFSNKDAVALAAFEYNYNKLLRALNLQLEKSGSASEKLGAYAKVYRMFLGSVMPEGGCAILNTAIEADDTHEALKMKAAKAVLKWKKTLEEIIKEGIAAGEFKKDTDPARLAISIIALVEGGMMIAKVTDNASSFDKVADTISLLVEGVSC